MLKIRGIFRLLRVFILIRKLNMMQVKMEVARKRKVAEIVDLRSPLERVLEILGGFRDRLAADEDKIIMEINYCIKMISSNKLFEADFELGELGEKKSGAREVMLLYG